MRQLPCTSALTYVRVKKCLAILLKFFFMHLFFRALRFVRNCVCVCVCVCELPYLFALYTRKFTDVHNVSWSFLSRIKLPHLCPGIKISKTR